MEVKSSDLNKTINLTQNSNANQSSESDIKFADELKDLKLTEQNSVNDSNMEKDTDKENLSVDVTGIESETPEESLYGTINNNIQTEPIIPVIEAERPDEALYGMIKINMEKGSVTSAIDNLTNVVSELNQSDDKVVEVPKDNIIMADNIFDVTDKKKVFNNDETEEGIDVINNDYNIDNKDKLPPMMPNMNFTGDGQPFSSFMNDTADNSNSNNGKTLSSTAKEIEEEAAILSTMAENIAMANKVNIATEVEPSKVNQKTVVKEDGIKKVDTETNIVKEVIVKYDTVVMNEADVQVFADLVDGKNVNLNDLTSESVHKSVQVSKTLADMLAKAMEDNKPVRIEFDNGISVIIKISRDGKLSADFLPSTQIAEAYLRENLPILKQRLSDQNLEYDELNQRERRNKEQEQNRKKGQEDE